MKIIRPGDIARVAAYEQFECHACGCVFECNKDEYGKTIDRNETLLHSECPTCSNMVYTVPKRSRK